MAWIPRIVVAVFSLACWSTALAAQEGPTTLSIFVTVDWEGESLDQENLEAMQQFRRRFPYIPLLQLMNPAYLLGTEPKEQIITSIRSTFLPSDTIGLHVHGWNTLLHACHIPYRSSPSFADQAENCQSGARCGYTVSLEYAYSQDELEALIQCSAERLAQHGFGRVTHFRAGGWQFGPKLQAALEKNGFVWDSSRIDPALLLSRWHASSSMIHFLQQLHPEPQTHTQPYALSAHLMEYPNNGGFADYTSSKQILALFNDVLGQSSGGVLVLGFHQETAADYLEQLVQAIPKMEQIAAEKGVHLQWLSTPISP